MAFKRRNGGRKRQRLGRGKRFRVKRRGFGRKKSSRMPYLSRTVRTRHVPRRHLWVNVSRIIPQSKMFIKFRVSFEGNLTPTGAATDMACMDFAPGATGTVLSTVSPTGLGGAGVDCQNVMNDLRCFLKTNTISSFDAGSGAGQGNRWGLVGVLLQSFQNYLIHGVKVLAKFQPVASLPKDNYSLVCVPVPYGYTSTIWTNNFWTNFKALGRRAKMRNNRVFNMNGASTSREMSISRYVPMKEYYAKYSLDPVSYGGITNNGGLIQPASTGAVSLSGPNANLGHIICGVCTQDGTNFAVSTTIGKFTYVFDVYVELWSRVLEANF